MQYNMTKTTLILFFSLAFLTLQAQDYAKFGVDTTYIPQGLEVGSIAPNFELKSAIGEVFSLKDALKTKQVIVVFYRGQWCPYCNRHLSNLSDSLNYLENKNAVVVAIGPETFENANRMEEKSGAEFIVLSDSKMNTMTD